MAARSLRVVNRSTHDSPRIRSALTLIRRALRVQLREVAAVWGEYVWQIVDDAGGQGFEIALFDDADAAGDLGFHDINENDGSPYARVYVNPILDNGGTWLRGPTSVAATVSHEACELVGDPTANHWVENARGALVAVELCDPVECCAYPIRLPDGHRVSVSDFVYPDWFNPYVPPGTQLDRMGALTKPFESLRDGYVLHHTSTGVRTIWGKSYPSWRKASKRKPGARTHIRHKLG